ncbi:MAG: hypothetical protein HXL33_09370 [Prevotellaceae bacterium]|nr:hypothetical protein [Prevotellaceae bacterium]
MLPYLYLVFVYLQPPLHLIPFPFVAVSSWYGGRRTRCWRSSNMLADGRHTMGMTAAAR